MPFSRFLRLVDLATHEQEMQYKLHMEGASFVSWMIHAVNSTKPEKYEKWQEMLNLRKPEKFDIEKEKALAMKNFEWINKPMEFKEMPIKTSGRAKPKRG